jgi:hypothetical protein
MLAAFFLAAAGLHAGELKPYTGAGCAAVDDFFAEEVWVKVGEASCLK